MLTQLILGVIALYDQQNRSQREQVWITSFTHQVDP